MQVCFPSVGVLGGSDGKESACNTGDLGSIPRSDPWVRSLGQEDPPGEGNGYPLQYSCLENSMDRGAWRAIVYGITESDMTEQLILYTLKFPRTIWNEN